MFDSPNDKKLQEGMKANSKIISIVIRNAMEDFHTKHLSDEQMEELNPIIRNAVYTALYAGEYQDQSSRAKRFLDSQMEMIPGYWEEPKLLEGMSEGE